MNTTGNFKIVGVLLLILHLVFGFLCLQNYMPWQSVNFAIAVLGLPILVVKSISKQRSYRFFIVAAVFAVLALLTPVKTFLFLSLVFSAAATIELFFGKISYFPLLIVLVISPLSYVFTVFSFPIRMWLTGVVATVLNVLGGEATAIGNVIIYNNLEYTVDPACMGLKMLTTSFWFALYMLFFIQEKNKRRLPFIAVMSSLIVVLALNIITNFSRIILLVVFNLSEANVIHYLVGLACFLVYSVLPMLVLFNWFTKKVGKKTEDAVSTSLEKRNYKWAIVLPISILAILSLSVTVVHNSTDAADVVNAENYNIEGYSISMYDKEVIQLKNDTSLIYVKRIRGFYSSEHNPLMCWIGSGYEFYRLKKLSVDGVDIYTGTLKKGDDVLHTAWWFDNGINHTTSQLEWRWDLITGGKQYSVINITCDTEQDLRASIQDVLKKQTLKPLFAQTF